MNDPAPTATPIRFLVDNPQFDGGAELRKSMARERGRKIETDFDDRE